jgi:hypothetical protein
LKKFTFTTTHQSYRQIFFEIKKTWSVFEHFFIRGLQSFFCVNGPKMDQLWCSLLQLIDILSVSILHFRVLHQGLI